MAYENAFATVLFGWTVLNVAYLAIPFGPRSGIRLPDNDHDQKAHFFNVPEPEDIAEDYSVDSVKAVRSRRQARALQVTVTILLGISLLLETAALFWALPAGGIIPAPVFRIVYFGFLWILSFRVLSTGRELTAERSILIINIAVSLWLATLLIFAEIILPYEFSPIVSIQRRILVATFVFCLASATVQLFVPRGLPQHYPLKKIYDNENAKLATSSSEQEVAAVYTSSIAGNLLFLYASPVVRLANTLSAVSVADLPVLPASMRATTNFRNFVISAGGVSAASSNEAQGQSLARRLIRVNFFMLAGIVTLAVFGTVVLYVPILFLRLLLLYLEEDPTRVLARQGWNYAAWLFIFTFLSNLLQVHLQTYLIMIYSIKITTQLNSILFHKTLSKKDLVGTNTESHPGSDTQEPSLHSYASKGQILTLFSTDCDRAAMFLRHLISVATTPISIVVGVLLLFNLLGVSSLIGLAITIILLPVNNYTGNILVDVQKKLMKRKDERMSLMNEILGSIRMLKFMTWERLFENRVSNIRKEELTYQRKSYIISAMFNFIWNMSPILVLVLSFWHFAAIRSQPLTPSVAFTSITVFSHLRFALNAIPETIVGLIQSVISLRRIEGYLDSEDVDIDRLKPSEASEAADGSDIVLASATVTWSRDGSGESDHNGQFSLVDLNLVFPSGQLSLICGRIGSGKTLLLHALLGEANILSGEVKNRRRPFGDFSQLEDQHQHETWIDCGSCAYVPEVAWLQNTTLRNNILFGLPYRPERYEETIEACALVEDLQVLQDGDMCYIGEKGITLSGGQKARVSLARAVYSRASTVILDDILSAVDNHTASHIYHKCIKGPLMYGRTVILVSHNVHLSSPGASYIVTLDQGRVAFAGGREEFAKSGLTEVVSAQEEVEERETSVLQVDTDEQKESVGSRPKDNLSKPVETKQVPEGKLIDEEKRAVGKIDLPLYMLYFTSCGHYFYWTFFILVFVLGALVPVAENGWLRYWSSFATSSNNDERSPGFYVGIYAAIAIGGAAIQNCRWLILYYGSVKASARLYEKLLDKVIFATSRFHDTTTRGRLLNRFGKDFEGIDSNLAESMGHTVTDFLSVLTAIITVTVVGGPLFILVLLVLGAGYYNVAKLYGQVARDTRRLYSTTRSPLFSLYEEAISGIAVIRAFGMPANFIRDLLQRLDANMNAYFWMFIASRWMMIRFNLLSSVIVGATAFLVMLNPSIDASYAGFMLAFATVIVDETLYMFRRYVALEQSMVSLERVHEYFDIPSEPAEIVEPRPPASWPSEAVLAFKDVTVQYAPDLPTVLHDVSFESKPNEKIGILGRTGSGKSTLFLSLFRFVEPIRGRISIDGVNTSLLGLKDLRGRMTIIPQDPTILSGTLRDNLDPFGEYEDSEVYDALRRVHLLPSSDSTATSSADGEVDDGVFQNLDSGVAEGGGNFSAGQKQLICMARALLRRSKILVMDEATASVDLQTDTLIQQTLLQEFSNSTVLTIAHRIRTVIEYDRVMVLQDGRIVEFDKPGKLLEDEQSRFYGFCKAAGSEEFAALCGLAGWERNI